MKYCSNIHCPDRQRSDPPPGWGDKVEVCPACGESLSPPEQAESLWPASLLKKAVVSLAVLGVCLAGRHLILPSLAPTMGSSFATNPSWSVLALGAKPLLSGFVLVEFLALLVPAWRALRVGGPSDRAKLHRASVRVGMLVATVQACFLTIYFEKMGVARDFGASFRIVTVLTLVGATAVLVVLAKLVEIEGLGGGFSILLLAEVIPNIFGPLGDIFSAQSEVVPFSVLLNVLLCVALLAGATLWMFSRYALPSPEARQHPSLVSRPACGLVPLTLVPAVLVFVSAWTRLSESQNYLLILLALTIAVTLLLAFLFNPPQRIATVWNSLLPGHPENIPRLNTVLLESVLYILFATCLETWGRWRMSNLPIPNAVAIIVATGILYDLVREWQAHQSHSGLTPVWEIHQSYAVAPTLRLLESEGIPAFAKSRHLRALLQFFGPYVPVLLLVPADQAQRAQALLQTRWPMPHANARESTRMV